MKLWLTILLFPAFAFSTPVKMIFVGDIMLDRIPGQSLAAGKDPFKHVAPLLDAADLRVANLESAVAPSGTPVDKHYVFLAKPEALKPIRKHFEAISLANNHSGDFGHVGLFETFAYLKQSGLAYFGAGANHGEAHKPWIVEKNGLKIAVLGYNEFRPRSFEAGPTSPGVAWSEDKYVEADIKAVRPKVDLVFTYMHWGEEYVAYPSERQKTLARKMIDAGADVVVGNHPHITEIPETYKGKLIVYSLGNFVFDDFADIQREDRRELEEICRTSWILRLTVDKDGVKSWDTVVARTGEDGFPRIVKGSVSPSSDHPTPPAVALTAPKPTLRPTMDRQKRTDVETIRLAVIAEKGSTPVADVAVYSLDGEFLETSATFKSPQVTEEISDRHCSLTKMNYLLPAGYPDPTGFEMGLTELSVDTLNLPLRGLYRELPGNPPDHKHLIDLMSRPKVVTLRGKAKDSARDFTTKVPLVGNFDLRTDNQLVPGQDFKLQLTGAIHPETVRVSFAGFDTGRNQGYNLRCNFPTGSAAPYRLSVPGTLTAQIPFADYSQSQVALAVEPSNTVLIEEKSPAIRVWSANRVAVSVPVAAPKVASARAPVGRSR